METKKYTKIEKIGHGTFGVVWKSIDNENNEIVAIKKIKLENIEEGIPATALREISSLLELNHPNIVLLKDIDVNEKKMDLIFEYLEFDLKKYILKNNGKLEENESKSFLYQALCGLFYCHSNRHLHRDLKPQNLLITSLPNEKNKILKLADFGLARTFGNTKRDYSNEVVTLWYRCPELLLGSQKYKTSIDLWSVGCIFSEMVTGKPLFPGRNRNDQLNLIFKFLELKEQKDWEEMTQLPNWNPSFLEIKKKEDKVFNSLFSEKAIDLFYKMLQVNPSHRISSIDSLNHPFFEDVLLPSTLKKMTKSDLQLF